MYYESEQDVELRLKGSVVMLSGKPVYVLSARSRSRVNIKDIISGDESTVDISQLDLAPSSAPLGYVLDERGRVFYTSRRPSRRYKQGLTSETLTVVDVNEPMQDRDRLRGNHSNAAMRASSPEIARTMMGEFPSIEKAFKRVRSGVMLTCPFDRHWAVTRASGELKLQYRGTIVGVVGDKSVTLDAEYFYLQEILSDVFKGAK